jgi:hypothetical protein
MEMNFSRMSTEVQTLEYFAKIQRVTTKLQTVLRAGL